MDPWNNLGYFHKGNGSGWQARAFWIKEMPLSARPESGWIAIGSHAAQRAPGLRCGAFFEWCVAALARGYDSIVIDCKRSATIPGELCNTLTAFAF